MTSGKVSETVPSSISITQNCFALIHYLHKAKFNGHNKDIRRTKSYFTEDNSFYLIPMSDMITRTLTTKTRVPIDFTAYQPLHYLILLLQIHIIMESNTIVIQDSPVLRLACRGIRWVVVYTITHKNGVVSY